MKLTRVDCFRLGCGALFSLATAGLYASGFQLWEESLSGTGDYHAGAAAIADDASTEFYNPAGMIRLQHPQISVGAALIPLYVKFQGDVSALNGLIDDSVDWTSGNTSNLVPNLHLVVPVNDRWAVGFGATVPFGLSTSYPWTYNLANSGGSSPNIAGTVTRLEAFNLNPNVAFAITPHFSVGGGVDFVYGTAEYDSAVLASAFTNEMSDTAWGWNAGALYEFSENTRVGLSYRSELRLHATGTSKLYSDSSYSSRGDLNANLTLPDYAILSLFQRINPKWDFLGSAYYTRWNSFDTLTLNNTALIPFLGGPDVTVHENYHSTWNFALGTNYHLNPLLTFKLGVGYDQTPTRDGYRDIRLPDTNRIALAAGIHALVSKASAVDLGWIHFFTKSVNIDNTQSGSAVLTTGTGNMSADVLGLQFSVNFA